MSDQSNQLFPQEPGNPEENETPLLLPAWSKTTINSRAAQAPVVVHNETSSGRGWWANCLIGAIAAVIVLSLLGSSLFSIYWFWNIRQERIAEVANLLEEPQPAPQSSSADGRPARDDEGVNSEIPTPALQSVQQERLNRIVFVNENRQIETIDPDGSSRRQITSDARSYIFPSWSESGNLIAAIGTTISGAGIYVMPDEMETGALEEIHFSSDESPFYLYWAPDGSQITFLANERSLELSLNVIGLDGDSASRTIALGSPMYWNWAADSRQMLVHSGSGSTDSQLVMLDDFGRPQTPRVPSPGLFQAPGISPNGHYWAYSQFQAGGTSWLVINDRLEGSENRKRHAGAVAFSWSPVKDELAFITGSGGDELSAWGPLRLMDAQTGEVRVLSSDMVLAFFWSPDGRKVATISVQQENNLGEQYEVRGDKTRLLAKYSPENAALPAAQIRPPHSFRINVIDVESGEGLQLAEVALSAVFLTQFIPYFDQYAFSHHVWSPDSNALVLPIVEGQFSELSIIDTRNGNVTPLAEGSIGFWSAR
jgi:TolB protein